MAAGSSRYYRRHIESLGLGPDETASMLDWADDALEILDHDVPELFERISRLDVPVAILWPAWRSTEASISTSGFDPAARLLARDIDDAVTALGAKFSRHYRIRCSVRQPEEPEWAGVAFLIEGRVGAGNALIDDVGAVADRFGIDRFLARESGESFRSVTRNPTGPVGWLVGHDATGPRVTREHSVMFEVDGLVIRLERRLIDDVGPMGCRFILQGFRAL